MDPTKVEENVFLPYGKEHIKDQSTETQCFVIVAEFRCGLLVFSSRNCQIKTVWSINSKQKQTAYLLEECY